MKWRSWKSFTEWFESYKVESGVMMTPPMDASLALHFLLKYLLGEKWYTFNTNSLQANTEIVFAILFKYSRKFRKEWKKFRKEENRRKNNA